MSIVEYSWSNLFHVCLCTCLIDHMQWWQCLPHDPAMQICSEENFEMWNTTFPIMSLSWMPLHLPQLKHSLSEVEVRTQKPICGCRKMISPPGLETFMVSYWEEASGFWGSWASENQRKSTVLCHWCVLFKNFD